MLTLGDIKLILDDIQSKRMAAVNKSTSGKLAAPELTDLSTQIDALPAALTGNTALAQELAAADDVHDEAGRVIFYATEAVFHDKSASADALTAAQAIRAQLIPELAELADSYPDEVARAHGRRPLLSNKTFKAQLALVPLSDGRTLLDPATRMLDAGDLIGTLLSNRADVKKPDRKAASALRPEALGELNDFKKNLTKEVARNPKLPQDLVSQVFAYFDLLSAHRQSAKKADPAPPPPVVAPPAPSAATTAPLTAPAQEPVATTAATPAPAATSTHKARTKTKK